MTAPLRPPLQRHVAAYCAQGPCAFLAEFSILAARPDSPITVSPVDTQHYEAWCKDPTSLPEALVIAVQIRPESPAEFFRTQAKLFHAVPTLLIVSSDMLDVATEALAWGISDFVVYDKEGAPAVVAAVMALLRQHELGDALALGAQIADELRHIEEKLNIDAQRSARDPLSSILGVTKLLIEKSASPELISGLEIVHRAAEQLNEMVDNWPNLPTGDSGEVQRCSSFSLRERVLYILELLAPEARRQGVGLFYDFNLPVETDKTQVEGDLHLLRQSLVLLIGNLVKLVGTTGVVKVTCSLLQSASPFRSCYLDIALGCVSPEPSGGESPEARRVRQQRFRAGVLKTLAMVDFLVRHTRGVLSVERWAAPGCRIRLVLPFRMRTEAAAEIESLAESLPPSSDFRPIRVLVAEDSTVNQVLLQRFLTKRGYEVKIAGNGLEAIEAFRQQHFDLVLMDIRMPECDGYEATKEIRAIERSTGTHCPIFAVTAHLDTSDRAACLASGFDELFVKPLDLKALEREITKVRDAILFAAVNALSSSAPIS